MAFFFFVLQAGGSGLSFLVLARGLKVCPGIAKFHVLCSFQARPSVRGVEGARGRAPPQGRPRAERSGSGMPFLLYSFGAGRRPRRFYDP